MVYAVYDYAAENNDELAFRINDQLTVLRKGDDRERDWWWTRRGDTEGYVPRNLLGVSVHTRTHIHTCKHRYTHTRYDTEDWLMWVYKLIYAQATWTLGVNKFAYSQTIYTHTQTRHTVTRGIRTTQPPQWVHTHTQLMSIHTNRQTHLWRILRAPYYTIYWRWPLITSAHTNTNINIFGMKHMPLGPSVFNLNLHILYVYNLLIFGRITCFCLEIITSWADPRNLANW